MYTIKPTQAKEIIEIACDHWKEKPVIEKIFQEEFKVGDLVVLTSNKDEEELYGSNNSRIPTGEALKVKMVEKSIIYPANWLHFVGYEEAVTANQARKATPEEITTYNNPYKKGELYLAWDKERMSVKPLRYDGEKFIDKDGDKWKEREWEFIKPITVETIKEFFG